MCGAYLKWAGNSATCGVKPDPASILLAYAHGFQHDVELRDVLDHSHPRPCFITALVPYAVHTKWA